MSLNAVEAKTLSKRFQDQTALNELSFTVSKGESVGILGPEGSGKSTLIDTLSGLLSMEEGELYILGMNQRTHSRDIKERIGVLRDDFGLDSEFSVLDNLLIYARYHQIPANVALERSKHLLRMMKLDDFWHLSVEALSADERKILALARSFINQPELVLLDEPTSGVTKQCRLFVIDLLRRFKTDESTVVLTTNSATEIEQLCDTVVLLDRGTMIAMGSPTELILQHIGLQVLEMGLKPEDVPYFARKLSQDQFDFLPLDNKIVLFLRDLSMPEKILNLIPSQEILFRPANLSDVFLRLSGYELEG